MLNVTFYYSTKYYSTNLYFIVCSPHSTLLTEKPNTNRLHIVFVCFCSSQKPKVFLKCSAKRNINSAAAGCHYHLPLEQLPSLGSVQTDAFWGIPNQCRIEFKIYIYIKRTQSQSAIV